MKEYRIYPLASSGRIGGPPREVRACDDEEARRAAQADGTVCLVEIWTGARLVGQFEPSQGHATAPSAAG